MLYYITFGCHCHLLTLQWKNNISKMEKFQWNKSEIEGQNSVKQYHLERMAYAM